MSFANEVKRWVNPRTAGGQMGLALVALTIAAAVHPVAYENLVLVPESVLREYKVWLVATHMFIVPVDALTIIFGVIILITCGNFLEQHWGTRRLWFFVAGVGLTSAVAVLVVGLFSKTIALFPVFGGLGVMTWLWVAQGLLMGSGRANFFGFPVSGYAFAAIGAAFPVINALRGGWPYGWLLELETFVGLALTVAYVYHFTPAALWTRFRSWQLHRELNRRSSHLKVVGGEKRNMPGDSDKYLH